MTTKTNRGAGMTTKTKTGWAVWCIRERGILAGPFPTQQEARRHLYEMCGGPSRHYQVRRV